MDHRRLIPQARRIKTNCSVDGRRSLAESISLPGLVPAIHVLPQTKKDADARDEPGHDEL